MVIAVFFDDAENAGRSWMAGHAGRHCALRHAHAIAVERDFLRPHIDDDLQRPLRHLAEADLLLGLSPGFAALVATAAYVPDPVHRVLVLHRGAIPAAVITQAARIGGLREAEQRA